MVRSAAALAMFLLLPASASAQEVDPGTRMHVIQEGNTLWGLAERFYGSADEWTRIFEANRDRIEDPEVLPTGLELVIPNAGAASVSGIVVMGPREDSSAPPLAESAPSTELSPESDLRRRGAGPPVYVDGVFYRAPWLIQHGSKPAGSGTIMELDHERRGSSVRPFDRVRIAVEGSLPTVGSRLQAFRVEGDHGAIGRVVQPTGTLTVVEVASTHILAEANDLFARMTVGDFVRPLPAPPVTLDQASRPVTERLRVHVIGFAEFRPLRVPGDYLFLETGTNGGVRAGDVFEVGDGGGTVQVVTVHDAYATARIARLENPKFEIGVELRLSRRMQ